MVAVYCILFISNTVMIVKKCTNKRKSLDLYTD